MFTYAYAAGTLFFMAIWAALFVLLPRSRSAIFWTSLIFAAAGPISEFWQLSDYWHPLYLISIAIGKWRFGLEDYLMAFAYAGISAGVFESMALRRGFGGLPRVSFNTLLRMEGWGTVAFLLMAFLASGLRLNSIYSILLAGTISSLLMLYRRWETFPQILTSAIILGLLFWLFYVVFFIPIFPGVIQAFWNLKTTSGIMLAGVPIEEPLSAFTTALLVGPVFRVCSTKSS